MRETITKILDEIGLLHRFDMIISKNDVARYKPDIEGLEKIIFHYPKIKRSDIVFIGNSWKDEEVAKKANVEFVGVKNLVRNH